MKKILLAVFIFFTVPVFAQEVTTVSKGVLYFQGKLFDQTREILLKGEYLSGTPLLPQPDNPRLVLLSLVENWGTKSFTLFAREKNGTWLQVTTYSLMQYDLKIEYLRLKNIEVINIWKGNFRSSPTPWNSYVKENGTSKWDPVEPAIYY